ncbi:ribosomal protein [Dispira parvispora]|uniref:Ribosomal protein n=1 Tax=Dispira parvispora TaxID=1520584 RepID=A0A9W8ATJ7_9FUNG|nr:ribosomal protein [Dispira parvispora]
MSAVTQRVLSTSARRALGSLTTVHPWTTSTLFRPQHTLQSVKDNCFRRFSTTSMVGYHNRLREHYLTTLQDDIMAITYEHPDQTDPNAPPAEAVSEEEPSEPIVQGTPPNPKHLLLQRRPKRSAVPASRPDHVYDIDRVVVHIRMREAIDNKFNLLSGLMAIQCMTGKRGEVVYSRSDVAAFKLRKGMPTAVKVELAGDDMYTFLDKLVEVVLPQIKEWNGLPSDAGDSNGNITFGFEPHVMGLFPDIEGVYDMIPLITGFHVTVRTTAYRDPPARLVLSGYKFPFREGRRRKARIAPTKPSSSE